MITNFQTNITVRVTDLNYGGHLGNDSLYGYFHQARVCCLRHLGLTEGDIGGGISLTQIEGHIKYKGEAFLGDLLQINVWFDDIKRTRFRTNYRVIRPADDRLIAEGYAVLAAFDYQSRRPQRLPASFVGKISAINP